MLTRHFSLFLLLISSTVQAQTWESRMDSVLTLSAHEDLFHGQVLIAENGHIMFHKSYGQRKEGGHVTNNSPLQIASVSKVFTALAVLTLEERGLLILEQKLSVFFPQLPYEVSLESMLNMTSGLPRFQPTIEQHADTRDNLTTNEIIELVAQHPPAAQTPGSSFAYNGDNYLLLAAIVEEVTGEPFTAFVKKNILKPLGMDQTYFVNPDQAIGSLPLSKAVGPALGAGHMYSTASDIYKLTEALKNNQLLSAETLIELKKFTQLNDGSHSNYRYGWRLHREGESLELYVVGDGEQTRASVQRFLSENKTFIYLHNVSGAQWQGVYQAARSIWEGQAFVMPRKRIVFQIDKALFDKYKGQYLSKAFGLLHVTVEQGKLYLRPDPIPGKEELIPSSNTTFFFGGQALEWEFFLDEQSNVIGLGLRGKPETMGPKQKDK